jgi:hypothetical protein
MRLLYYKRLEELYTSDLQACVQSRASEGPEKFV